jgi:ABC-type phosphate/phosphonate transport system substrate-binding protein
MGELVASLPMYDFPECAAATDDWWAGLTRHFTMAGVTGLPAVLTRPGEGPAFWLRRDMLCSQACGYPLITSLAGRVALLATPGYDAPGCEGADYCSVIIVREEAGWSSFEELRGAVCAVNLVDSWSGHQVLRLMIAMVDGRGEGAFCKAVHTGGHAASIAAVARGDADFAAIDCVTHAMLSRYRPKALSGTRVLCRSPAMPGLPLIAGRAASARDIKAMREGLSTAMADPELASVRKALGLSSIHFLSPDQYDRMAQALEKVERAGVEPLL